MPTPPNNFASRASELKPRELMERAADPALVSDEALVAVLLKTGAPGLNVIELARRLIDLGQLAGIPVRDHLVLGAADSPDGFISIRATADIDFQKGKP